MLFSGVIQLTIVALIHNQETYRRMPPYLACHLADYVLDHSSCATQNGTLAMAAIYYDTSDVSA